MRLPYHATARIAQSALELAPRHGRRGRRAKLGLVLVAEARNKPLLHRAPPIHLSLGLPVSSLLHMLQDTVQSCLDHRLQSTIQLFGLHTTHQWPLLNPPAHAITPMASSIALMDESMRTSTQLKNMITEQACHLLVRTRSRFPLTLPVRTSTPPQRSQISRRGHRLAPPRRTRPSFRRCLSVGAVPPAPAPAALSIADRTPSQTRPAPTRIRAWPALITLRARFR